MKRKPHGRGKRGVCASGVHIEDKKVGKKKKKALKPGGKKGT